MFGADAAVEQDDMRLLLAEDDRKVSDFVARGLRAERFAVDLADVPYDDFRMLRALHEEREAYRNEQLAQQNP